MDKVSQEGEGSALDKRPAPDLSGGRAVSAPYVDNANVLGFDSTRVQEKLDGVVIELDKQRLRWHEKVDAGGLFEMPGVEVHGRHGRVRHKPRRVWRLYRGIEFLLRSPTVPGWQVRVYIGHGVTVCQLMRPALACLRSLYDFVSGAPVSEWRVLPAACRSELSVIKGLLLMAEVDLQAAPADIAFMSDASLKGYALYETLANEREVREMTRWRERVRFVSRPVEENAEGDFKGTLAGPRTEPGVADFFELKEGEARSAARARPTSRPREEIETGIKPDDLPEAFLNPERWHLVIAGAWRDPGRTHELEARTEVLGLRRAARDPQQHGSLLLPTGDNLGAVCAFEKGRATSLELLAHCRHSAAAQISCEIRWWQRHVVSEKWRTA